MLLSKKPIALVLDEQLDTIDDDTFPELAVDKERLNAAIRTGEATSIAKTKPRRSTVGKPKPIVLLPPDNWGDTNDALNGPATAQSTTHDALNVTATAYHDLGDTVLRDDDAQSLSNV